MKQLREKLIGFLAALFQELFGLLILRELDESSSQIVRDLK